MENKWDEIEVEISWGIVSNLDETMVANEIRKLTEGSAWWCSG